MTHTNVRALLTLASGFWLGACADPCVDDGLLQKEGDPATCAALVLGTGGQTAASVTATATEGASADGGGCDNGVRDGDETDVDCGGTCDTKCGAGGGCGGNGDCQSGSCDTDAEMCGAGSGTCTDGTQNQDETDVDCGGVCGASCEVGEGCGTNEDCVSDLCGQPKVCEPNPLWCADTDGDGSGDPNDCVMVDDDEDPPDGWVNNDNDCDDTNAFTFPGAAPNDSATDCMEDKDEDDWGDDTPAGASTIPGTDCDDGDSTVPPSCLTVDVTANPINIAAGEMSNLLATPMLGDGNYAFAWAPAASLDDTTIAGPTATPGTSTTYDVTVSDGNGDMATGDVTVHVTDVPLDLGECEEVDLGVDIDGNPTPVWDYTVNGTQACETNNGDPTALVCNVQLDDAMFRARFAVQQDSDDDHIGFVWGYQDATHFYLLTWKEIGQTFTSCGVDVPTGVVIKVINAAGPLQCEDLLDDTDTPNSTVLALPNAFYAQGWNNNEEYIFELEQTPMGFTVRIIVAAGGAVLAEQTFNDTTYTAGRFGVYTYSQSSSCFWDVFTSGL